MSDSCWPHLDDAALVVGGQHAIRRQVQAQAGRRTTPNPTRFPMPYLDDAALVLGGQRAVQRQVQAQLRPYTLLGFQCRTSMMPHS